MAGKSPVTMTDEQKTALKTITILRQSRRYSNCCPLKGGFSQLKKEKTINRRKPSAIFPTLQPYFVVELEQLLEMSNAYCHPGRAGGTPNLLVCRMLQAVPPIR